MLIDVHAHVSSGQLADLRDEIAQNTLLGNPNAIIDTGADMSSSEEAVRFAKGKKNVFATVGVHPESAFEVTDENLQRLLTWTKEEKTVAVGEIGLDYYWEQNPPREIQKEAFVKQIELSNEAKLPVVVHVRDAHGDAAKILTENKNKLRYGLLVHCYSGSKEMLAVYNKLDAYYSFGGVLTFKNAKEKPEVLRAVPIDRLLLETDSPYMTPVPFRGKLNRPEYVRLVAEKAAEILGKPTEEIEEITSKNALRLFNKMKLRAE